MLDENITHGLYETIENFITTADSNFDVDDELYYQLRGASGALEAVLGIDSNYDSVWELLRAVSSVTGVSHPVNGL